MTELQRGQFADVSSGSVPPHRQLLGTVDKYNDSASDRDGTTDDEVDITAESSTDDVAGSLLDISISRAQTYVKSPNTPAFVKAQLLDESYDYFDPDIEDSEVSSSPPSHTPDQSRRTDDADPKDTTSAFRVSRFLPASRSSLTRAVLGSGQNETRRRSSSGPSAILDSLRKVFTDFPAYPGFGSSGKQEEIDTGDSSPAMSNATRHIGTLRSTSRSQLRPNNITGLDGATSSSDVRDSRPKALRRVTSDNSLYLKRAVTGASDFDDTTAFAKVAEMPNNRFKAITDSLADSSIKMPKMSSVTFNTTRTSPSRAESETTKRNTALNSGTELNSTLNGDDNATYHVPPSDKKHPVLTDGLSYAEGDIVFLGGYRGSVLRSADYPHQQLWVPVKVGLNLRKVDLEVGLTHEDEEKMTDTIIPSGILSHIGPIDIARRLLKKIRKCPNVKANLLRVHDWGYDWRLSPHFLSRKFIEFLESLECNQLETPPGKRGALVVAHSLGGLITRHAVNLRPELFSGVVYAGTPQNCCNILGPLRNGDDVLLSSRVLTAQVNFTLRTSYALLPENGRCFLNKHTGERYDIDFFDVNSWDEYRLSPCINTALPASVQPQPPTKKSMVSSITDSISSLTPSLPSKRSSWFSSSNENATTSPSLETIKDKAQNAKEDLDSIAKKTNEHIQSPKEEAQDSLEPSMKPSAHKPSVATAVTIPKDKAREYLTRTLAEIKQFKKELNHIPAHQDANRYPPHAIIFGKSVPTVYGAKVASREAIKCTNAYDDLAFAAGDGVVLASAAQLPHGYRCVRGGRVQSERGHIGLLGDLEGIGTCIRAVAEGRKRGVGLGNFSA